MAILGIESLMIGANVMERKGWVNTSRNSSGGVPRVWDFKFGSLMWAHKVPPMFAGDDIPWDMQFDANGASLEEK